VELLANAPTNQVRDNISVATGINGPSVLSDLPFFDVTRMLSQDFAHDYLEGSLGYELRLFLHHCVLVRQDFTLGELNTRIGFLTFLFLAKKPECNPPSFHANSYFPLWTL